MRKLTAVMASLMILAAISGVSAQAGNSTSVTISDQHTTGDTVKVDAEFNMTDESNFFVVIHENSSGDVLGQSDELSEGTQNGVMIDLNNTLQNDTEVKAMIHKSDDGSLGNATDKTDTAMLSVVTNTVDVSVDNFETGDSLELSVNTDSNYSVVVEHPEDGVVGETNISSEDDEASVALDQGDAPGDGYTDAQSFDVMVQDGGNTIVGAGDSGEFEIGGGSGGDSGLPGGSVSLPVLGDIPVLVLGLVVVAIGAAGVGGVYMMREQDSAEVTTI